MGRFSWKASIQRLSSLFWVVNNTIPPQQESPWKMGGAEFSLREFASLFLKKPFSQSNSLTLKWFGDNNYLKDKKLRFIFHQLFKNRDSTFINFLRKGKNVSSQVANLPESSQVDAHFGLPQNVAMEKLCRWWVGRWVGRGGCWSLVRFC